MTRIATLVALCACTAAPLAAQDSPVGIRGLGIPGRLESVRSRSTGGAFAAFDPLSALDEASLAGASRLTATTAGAASHMSDDLSGSPVTRRTARFPILQVYGMTWAGVALGGGYTSYLDRSYKVVIDTTVTLGGSQQAVTDTHIADGGVTDLRLVVARRVTSHFFVGAGLHVLSGSSRVSAERTFSDTSQYRQSSESQEIAYDGVGFSSSALLSIGRTGALQLAGYWRSDSRLRGQVNRNTTVSQNDLPTMVGGAVRFRLAPEAVLGASLTYRNWSVSADSNAYNTTNWSAGGEFGSPRLPIRVGARGGKVPFGPGGVAPTEFAVALGSGITLSDGRGVIDFGLERLRRTGVGLTETVWTAMAGVTIRP